MRTTTEQNEPTPNRVRRATLPHRQRTGSSTSTPTLAEANLADEVAAHLTIIDNNVENMAGSGLGIERDAVIDANRAAVALARDYLAAAECQARAAVSVKERHLGPDHPELAQ